MEEVEHLTVLTLNAWGIPYLTSDVDVRIRAISGELARGKYHIVNLQEIWSTQHYEKIRDDVRNVLPYSHYFHGGVVGSGCAIFSRYPIVDTFYHRYSHSGYFWEVWGSFSGIGVICCVIEHPIRKLHVFNTHLHADYYNNSDGLNECRTLQSYELAQFVRRTTRPNDAIIVSGDMNQTPDSFGGQVFLELTKLNDTYVVALRKPRECNTCNPEFNRYLHASNITSRIDCIFSSNAFECSSCSLVLQKIPNSDLHFSDHEGYTATLKFKELDINENTKYIDSPGSVDILHELYNVVFRGEQLCGEICWRMVLLLCVTFLTLIVMPIISPDTFYVIFPGISTLCGKAILILQLTCAVVCAVYLWVVLYIRPTDVQAFRAVSSEIGVALRALEGRNERKVK